LSVTAGGRTHRVIARAMAIRSRIAQRCMAIAEMLGSADGDFWMGVAQREGNLANLLMFLLGQVSHRELPGDVLDDLDSRRWRRRSRRMAPIPHCAAAPARCARRPPRCDRPRPGSRPLRGAPGSRPGWCDGRRGVSCGP
jgi:hypothetical protein